MNSVFSAFKTGKGGIDNANNENKNKSNGSGTNCSVNNKKLSTQDPTSYENLRHIREITMSNNFLASGDDNNTKTTSNTALKSPVIAVLPSVQSTSSLCDKACVDILSRDFNEYTLEEDTVDSATTNTDFLTIHHPPQQAIPYSAALPPSGKQTSMLNNELHSEPNLLACANATTKANSTDSSSSDSEQNFINKIKARSEQLIGGSTNSSRINNNKPRLSLSSASGVGFNNSMPSVHGRSVNGTLQNGSGAPTTRTRLSTHQRNLSLDFRSMGILLPPVSQVTNNRINVTQHHRNRSLDSALQRIPEVEVSSPSAESENTLCTNILLGPAMCAKTTGSEKNTKATNNGSSTEEKPISSEIVTNNQLPNSNSYTKNQTIDNKNDKNNIKDVVTHDNGFNSTSSNLSSSTSLTKIAQKKDEPASDVASGNKIQKDCDTTNKKREDLTSLGSDDSGIICCSESDQQSLNRIRRSRESLDSGEIDPSEEECIEILETISMDEEYRMVQSDLCAYSNNSDGKAVKRKGPSLPKTICIPIDYEDEKSTHISPPVSPVSDIEQTNSSATNASTTSKPSSSCASNSSQDTVVKTPSPMENGSSSSTKNEVIFRNFFGATKNAIFRTAQSIRENHDKKRKDQEVVKSPVEKKREFSMLRPMSRKHVQQTSNPPKNDSQNLLQLQNQNESLTKSSSSSSLSSCKEKRVPGIAQCMIVNESNRIESVSSCADRGHSSLLRFFESPIFNIHFAVHYLFYSKEPGVLSFIVNKIFSFPDAEVDLYIPQLILMYIQMDDLTDVLDPYLTYRCRRSADFSLKCSWLLEAYNFNVDSLSTNSLNSKKSHLALIRELHSKREKKSNYHTKDQVPMLLSVNRKTHYRSQSDATGILNHLAGSPPASFQVSQTTLKLSLGDLNSGRAFDNNCLCFESVRGTVNDLLGQQTVCSCEAPKLAPQKEFMRALIDIGKTLTSLQTKIEKTSRLRVLLNLINKNLPARVWLPLYSEIPHHIVRITEEKTAVLNSKDKTPYIIYVEVVEVNDIYTSPVIPKLMPTLRHTKSVEFLEGLCNKDASIPNNSLIPPEDDIWSQDDDLITAHYLNIHKMSEKDTVSQHSLDSMDSREASAPTLFNIGDVRVRHCANLNTENDKKSFRNDTEDPSAAVLKEPWDIKVQQIRESSPYGHLQNWKLLSAIVKCGDDLRQELMATQLLEIFKIVWEEENIDLWVRPYRIVCLSNDSGLIEPILNTVSLHQIKKNSKKSLRDYFIDEYGGDETEEFKMAQRNFLHSCAAYSLISYLLQVKDRHNGNILLHSDGHLIHIDFGFILSISPKNLGFEQSPFKLTPEYVDVLGGPDSELWLEFRYLLLKGLMAARKHMDRIINIVEIMRSSSQLPCFKNGCARTVRDLRNRFHMNLTEEELERKVEQLVQDSLNSYTTKLYDGYQYLTNGIL